MGPRRLRPANAGTGLQSTSLASSRCLLPPALYGSAEKGYTHQVAALRSYARNVNF
nr:hypothetical protein [Cressdnaviricota sp.]UOF82986.1 hypothetical protein [Cressdnaviricota sp.]UOF83109.1 hypothetical protein [Cressdnaviricota sp.]